MAAYLVLKPCVYVNADGVVVDHREEGSVAEIPDDVAAGLGDAVRPMVSGPVPDLLKPTPFPDDAEQVRGRRGRSSSAPAEVEAGDG